MANIALRVSRNYQDLVLLTRDILSCDKVAIYEHEADDEVNRTHIHALLIGCSVSTDTLKNRITKILGEKPQSSDWSFKNAYKDSEGNSQIVDIKFLTYMSKGILDPKYSYNITNEECNSAKLLWVNHKESPKATAYKVDKLNKKTKVDMLEIMLTKLTPVKQLMKETCIPDRSDIFRTIRAVLVENKQVLGMYKIIDFYDSITLRIDKQSSYNQFCAILDKRKPFI